MVPVQRLSNVALHLEFPECIIVGLIDASTITLIDLAASRHNTSTRHKLSTNMCLAMYNASLLHKALNRNTEADQVMVLLRSNPRQGTRSMLQTFATNTQCPVTVWQTLAQGQVQHFAAARAEMNFPFSLPGPAGSM